MKQTKKLTYNERTIVYSWGLDPHNWRRGKLYPDRIELVNSLTNQIRIIPNRKKGDTRYGNT